MTVKLKPLTTEGYLYVVPYLGDDIVINPEKVDTRNLDREKYIDKMIEIRSNKRTISLLAILEKLAGRRVKLTIEEKRITIELLEEEEKKSLEPKVIVK